VSQAVRRRRSWPAAEVEGRTVDLIEAHRSSIVFANSRRLIDRLTSRLNEIHPHSPSHRFRQEQEMLCENMLAA
jgi:Lhr-like helicase